MHIRTLFVGVSLVCLIAVTPWAPSGFAADGVEDLSQSWWVPKHVEKKDSSSPNLSTPTTKENDVLKASEDNGASTSSELSAGEITRSYQINQTSQGGPFVVPNWFASQPKPYTRPTEIFRSDLGFNRYRTGFPVGGGLLGGVVSGLAWGALGGPGWGWGGGWGGWGGGWGGWRGGWGGWRGGWGGWGPGWGGGWGGWGPGWGGGWGMGSTFSPGLGSFRSTGFLTPNVIQTEPSKASGNYYEPSTIDSTASGSYYASGTPAVVPTMQINKSPSNYWNDSSNPVPKNLR